MIEVVIALCYALGAWFYSILRYYDLWKRGKVPVVFFAFLHVFSLIVVFLFETGISAMISDVVSVIMHAYSVTVSYTHLDVYKRQIQYGCRV